MIPITYCGTVLRYCKLATGKIVTKRSIYTHSCRPCTVYDLTVAILHDDDNLRGYNELREFNIAAWNAIPPSYLLELLESMPSRCQAVFDANEMYTRC